MPNNKETIEKLSNILEKAEVFLREGNIKECLKHYKDMCKEYEDIDDYCTASYFYKKCLDISKRFKNLEGEIAALIGLGKCEENVFNINKSMEYMEKALNVVLN